MAREVVAVDGASGAGSTASTEGDEGITWEDQQVLAAVLRFLVNLQKPGLAKIAQAHGYSGAEHAEGWRLHRLASGEAQALTVVFGMSAPTPTVADVHTPALRAIDEFENLWFPRTRAIIQRVVPEDQRERFEAAFFHELSQQPLGPEVVGSVGTFLTRVVALEKSKEPGAREVRETLRSRGLTDAAVTNMTAQLASMKKLGPAEPAKPVDEAALAKVRVEQKRAVKELRAWYNDWGTTLRTAFNRKQLIQLGLITPARKKDDEPVDPPSPPTPA